MPTGMQVDLPCLEEFEARDTNLFWPAAQDMGGTFDLDGALAIGFKGGLPPVSLWSLVLEHESTLEADVHIEVGAFPLAHVNFLFDNQVYENREAGESCNRKCAASQGHLHAICYHPRFSLFDILVVSLGSPCLYG